MGELDGKVAIVTGGSQGIGNAIAHGLAAAGARIVVADLQGAEAAAEAFPDGVGLTADVADEAAVQSLVDEVAERCGSIDILVNNAGLYASLAMRPFTRDPARRVAPGDGRQRRLDVPDVPRRRAGDAARRRRPHRQHLVRDAVPRRARSCSTTSRARARSSPSPVRSRRRSGRTACSSTASRRASRCRPASRRTPRWSRSCATCRSRRARCSATRCRRTSSARSSTSPARRRRSSPGQTIVIDGGQYFH